MRTNELPIGVFDSGMGGLTVLRALKELLPLESFIYLGDTARLPYGTKSSATVRLYAVQMAKLLIERRIKALVIACNTATTAALSHLQNILSDIPVIGVVAPGANSAVLATKNQRIAVLATETTLASDTYQKLIRKQLPDVFISAKACSLLVALAEEGMVDNHVAATVLQHYLEHFSDEDTILLGCTHFPVFKQLLQKLLPDDVCIVDSAQSTAIALKQLLVKNSLLNSANKASCIRYLTTDSIKRFQKVGQIFLGEPLDIDAIELVDGV